MSETLKRAFESCMFNTSLLLMFLFQKYPKHTRLTNQHPRNLDKDTRCWRFAFARLLDLALVAPEQETILNEIVLHLFVSGCFRVPERKIKHARLACALAKPPDHAPAAPRPERLRMQWFRIGCVMVFFTCAKLVFS